MQTPRTTRMKDTSMKTSIRQQGLNAVVAALAIGATAGAWAADEAAKERDPREFTYLQLAGGAAMATSAPVNVGLGASVQLHGRASYDRGTLWGATLGYQFLREEDEQDKEKRLAAVSRGETPKEAQPMRAELEFWNASVTRNTIQVAAETVHPNDKVKPRALFLNVAIPIGESEEFFQPEDPKRLPEPLWRTWLGAGVGPANLSYPSASALAGCNCLRQASGSGLAYQLKLQFERQVSENTYLFAQIGRVWLPGVSTTQGTQATDYSRWGMNNLAVGVRWAFRD